LSFRLNNQVREHAAKVLAGLMKGGEEDLSVAFHEESYKNALSALKGIRQR
jgi:hypothetical protein